MRFEGRLTSWNDDRGFGFITPVQGGQEIFVHIKAFSPGAGRPQVDQVLTFEVELNPQGKKRAKHVQRLRAAPSPRAPRRAGPAPSARASAASRYAIPGFALVYLVVALLWGVSKWVGLAYAVMSVLCYAAYSLDKWAAEDRRWRIPESTLLALGLACGWPGAIVAQQVLRHKSSKQPFRSTFWGTVVLNVSAFVLLHSPLAGPLRLG